MCSAEPPLCRRLELATAKHRPVEHTVEPANRRAGIDAPRQDDDQPASGLTRIEEDEEPARDDSKEVARLKKALKKAQAKKKKELGKKDEAIGELEQKLKEKQLRIQVSCDMFDCRKACSWLT